MPNQLKHILNLHGRVVETVCQHAENPGSNIGGLRGIFKMDCPGLYAHVGHIKVGKVHS
jgi:hypothetical protein